ncbi:hypothetical protein BSL78_03216 [Apostichopus japonicus]|uniref:C2H2-type domain-containing protein n=1 Tax=Stichopus japonicus TaxID=307972 RepID=A0A2G8LHW3_STIJA|nr:hypothetical protein BSL78_03216 [Apostichopus japonicus]
MEVCEFLQRLIKSGKQVAATPKITDQRLPLYMKGLQVVPSWAPIIIKDNTSGERLIGHQWVSAIMELISAVLQAWIKSLLEWIFSASLATLTKKTLFLIEVASAIKRCLHALSSIKNNRITVDLRIAGLGWFQTLLSLLRTRSYPSCLGGGYFYPGDPCTLKPIVFGQGQGFNVTVMSSQRELRKGMSASDCIHDNPLQEDVAEDSLSCKFIEALQQAIVGQTLGPISSSICQIATETIAVSDEKSKTLDPERSTTSLKVILQGNNGEEESVSFIPAVDEDDAHLVIQKTGRGVYVKLMRRFETPSEIRGLVIDGQLKKDTAEVVVIKEEEEVDEGLVEHPPSSDTSHIDEEHILNVTKKCPNCSVCFRNTSNLLAHQTYYCTGRDHKEQAAPSPRDHHVSSKSLSVSQSSSPRLTSRSSSRNSSGSDEGSGSAQSVHVCQLCQSSFMSRQNCESHMLILHCGEHVPMCKFCNFVAGSWDILRDHVFTHVKVEKREEAQSSNGDRSVVGCNGCARLTEIGESDGVVGGDDSSRDNSQGRSNTKHFHVKHDSNSMNDNCNSNDSRETDDVHRHVVYSKNQI